MGLWITIKKSTTYTQLVSYKTTGSPVDASWAVLYAVMDSTFWNCDMASFEIKTGTSVEFACEQHLGENVLWGHSVDKDMHRVNDSCTICNM